MATTYQTRLGDTIDYICFSYYGNSDSATVIAVLEANRAIALADAAIELPAAMTIILTDIPATTTNPVVRLWT